MHRSFTSISIFWVLTLVLLAVSTAIVGCGEEEPTATPVVVQPTSAPEPTKDLAPTEAPEPTAKPEPTKSAVSPSSDGKRGGAIIRGVSRTLRAWDYNTEAVWFAPQSLQRHYSNLVSFDPSDGTTIQPDLATEWSIGNDAKSITFTIRDGVNWHDGQELSLEDIKWTFERAKSPPEGERYPRLTALLTITEITIVDDDTITIAYENTNAEFIQNFAAAWGIVLAPHVMEQEGGMNGPDRVVGTGPFIIDEAEMEEFVTSRRNPEYFLTAPDGDLFPYLDEMTSVALSDVEARIAAIQTGRVDIASFDPAEFAPAVGALGSMEDAVRMEVSPLAGINYLSLNAKAPPFDDLKARRAAYLLFDRLRMQQLESLPSGEFASVPTGFFGTVDPFIDEVPDLWEVSRATRTDALAEGKALAEEVGLEGFTMIVNSRSFFQELAQLAAQVYADAGWEIELEVGDGPALAERVENADYMVSMSTPNVVLPSVSAFLLEQYLPGGREPNAAEPPAKIYDLLTDLQAATDPATAHAVTREIQKVMREEWVPVVPMGKQVGSVELIANHVQDRPGALGQWFNLHTWTDVWVDDNSPRK
jgi:peptide/nickel transport system substrate-binding protein